MKFKAITQKFGTCLGKKIAMILFKCVIDI